MALVCFALATVAGAQERDRDRTLAASRKLAEDLRLARVHYGPWYLLSRVQLADIGYNQDYFVPTADTASGFSLGLSAPQRLYFTPNRKTFLSASFTPQWNRFRGNVVSSEQYGFLTRGDAQFLFNHLYLDVFALREHNLRANTGELSTLLTRKTEEVGVTGEMKYSSRTSMTYTALGRSYQYPLGKKDFQPNLPLNLLDVSEHFYRAALMHKTFPLTSLLVAGEYGTYSFSQAVFKNSRRKYAGAGAIFDGGRTVARLEAGRLKLDFLRSNQRDYSGTIGGLSIDHELTERWHAGTGFQRDLDFSIFANNNYYIANRASLKTSYSVTRRFSLNTGYTWNRNDYDFPNFGSTDTPSLLVRRRDRVTFPYVGWNYVTSHFQGGFDVGYFERTSNFPVGDEDGIRVIVRLSVTL